MQGKACKWRKIPRSRLQQKQQETAVRWHAARRWLVPANQSPLLMVTSLRQHRHTAQSENTHRQYSYLCSQVNTTRMKTENISGTLEFSLMPLDINKPPTVITLLTSMIRNVLPVIKLHKFIHITHNLWHLASLAQHYVAEIIHDVCYHNLSFLARSILLYIYTTIFILFDFDGFLYCFLFEAIMNAASLNTHNVFRWL